MHMLVAVEHIGRMHLAGEGGSLLTQPLARQAVGFLQTVPDAQFGALLAERYGVPVCRQVIRGTRFQTGVFGLSHAFSSWRAAQKTLTASVMPTRLP